MRGRRAQASAKLAELLATMQRNVAAFRETHPDADVRAQLNEGHVVVTPYSVTLLGAFPIRHVQFVLRCYRSPAEVLMGFDIDCACVGFDGAHVYALPRAIRALRYRSNLGPYLLDGVELHPIPSHPTPMRRCVAPSGHVTPLDHLRGAPDQVRRAWVYRVRPRLKGKHGRPAGTVGGKRRGGDGRRTPHWMGGGRMSTCQL